MIGPVAQLMAVIGLNTAPLEAGIAKSTGMLKATGPLAVAALAGGAVVAGVGVIATKMAGDFQEGINSLATGAGELTQNLAGDAAGILQLAKDTGESTQQLIAGLYMINSGGFLGAAGLKVLTAAAEGAKVGNADLGVVADATDTILKNYGEGGALTATQAVNTLITTVAHGKVHLEDLASSLSAVLPAASAAGIGLNGVMAAMATMTNVGVPAAESATYIRQLIVSLSAPAAGARGEMDKLGISMDTLSKKMHTNLGDALQYIVDKLHAAGIKEGSQQWVAAIRDIAGGQRQMQGLLVLTQHLDTVKADITAVGKASSATGDQVQGWALVQQNFNTQIARAWQVVQTLAIQLGQKLLPAATNVFKGLADNLIPALKNFRDFMSGSSDKANILKGALIALAGAIVANLVVAFYAWAAAAGAAAVATIEATWPILLIGAAIGLIAAGVIIVIQHWKEWTKAGTPLHAIMQAIQPILQKIGDLFGILGKIWQTQILPALSQLLPILKVVGIILLGGVAAAILFTVVTFIILVTAITGVILIVVKLVEGIVWAAKQIPAAWNLVKANVGEVWGWITTTIANAWTMITANIGNVLKWITDHFKAAWNLVTTNIQNVLTFIQSIPGKMLKLGEQIINNLAQGFRNATGNVMAAVKNIPGLGGVLGGASSAISGHIPHFASGGTMPYSGLAAISDNETVFLPGGSQVYTPRQMLAGGYGSGQPIVVQVQIDGRTAAQAIVPHMPGVIRAATGQRKF